MQPLYSLVGKTPAPALAPYAGAKKEPGTRRGARSPGSKLPLLLFAPLPLLLSPLMRVHLGWKNGSATSTSDLATGSTSGLTKKTRTSTY